LCLTDKSKLQHFIQTGITGYNEAMAETLLTSGGLRVESTLDPKIQAILNEEYADPSNYPENVKWYLNYCTYHYLS